MNHDQLTNFSKLKLNRKLMTRWTGIYFVYGAVLGVIVFATQ